MVSSNYRSQHLSVIAVMSILASAPVAAQDITVNDDRTTPIVSASDGGTNGGTITVTEGTEINVSEGTIITVNSPHDIVLEATSSISTEDLLAGRGLFLDATTERLISDLDIAGDITVGNVDSDDFGYNIPTSNMGIALDGDLGFEGDIVIQEDSTIIVSGGDGRGIMIGSDMTGDITMDGALRTNGHRAIGIDLDAPVTGDVTINGDITALDIDTVGVRVGETLNGAYIQRGSISVGQSASTDGDGNAVPARSAIAGLLIESDVTGGVLIDGIGANNELDLDGDGNDDITADASITSVGGGPAVLIRTPEGSTGLTLGSVGDTGYGYVQRGNIASTGESAGVPSTAFIIEGLAGAPATVEGGIYMDRGTVTSRAIDAKAIGMEFGAYSNVPTFYNAGTIDVDTYTSSTTDDQGTDDSNDDVTIVGPGGEAVGLVIRENASLPTINNEGIIGATARGDGQNAVAILDESGTLTSIINSGSIGAVVEDDENGQPIAIDVRANTSGISLENSGLIVGDIYLGSGDDSVTFSNGDVLGDLYFGTGNDTFTLTGEATFSGSVDFDGTLGLVVDGADLSLGQTDQLHFSSATFTNGASLIFNIDPEDATAGQLITDGALTASADVNIQPVFTSFTDTEQSFELIRAGSINFADSSTSLELSNTPYFFNVSLTEGMDGAVSTVTLDVSRKSADELDIATPLATLYENMTETGFVMDSPLETSLAGVVGQEEAEAALTALMPDVTNASFNAAYSAERQFANHLANRLTDFMSERESFEGGAWVREVTTFGDHTAANSLQNSDVLTVGLTMGYDRPISDHFAWGVNAGFTLNGYSGKDDTINSEFSSFAPFLSLYTMGRFGPVYMGLQASGQYVDIERQRTIEFGSVSRIVDSTTSGWNLVGTAEMGLDLSLGGLRLVPYGRISAQKYTEGGYTEDGGDSANLTIGDRSFSRTQAGFGASLGYDFKWKRPRETKIIRPEVFYSYAKTISGADPAALDAIFVAGDTSFALEIDQMSESVEQYGGAFNLFGDGSKARVHYAYEKLDDVKAHAISVNFALTF